jgi:DNA-binding NarL/FixJ family response regulator
MSVVLNATIRVMVVDDSASTRGMLRQALALEGSFDVIGEAGTGAEAIKRAHELVPDVILMDVRMPDLDGVKAARAIMADIPSTKIVALTWSDDPATVRDMLTAGAIGYVVKGGTIEELYTAIRRAATGEAELDQRVLPGAVEDLRRLLETERSRREQVERLARSRAEFVQVLSHELRTPLTVISGTLRMLQSDGQAEETGQLLETALRRAHELEFLVEGLELVASGPSDEGIAFPHQAVQLATERLSSSPDRNEVIDVAWPGVSHKYLCRVAFELLSNAFRHGKRPVEVASSLEDELATLTVTDASGWAPANDDFGAFVQEDMTATRTKGGFGLGLFLVSRLCEASDGSLSIESVDGKSVAQARFRIRS